MPQYAVPITYRGLEYHIVEASGPNEAKRLAKERFNNGIAAPFLGPEWETIEEIGEPEETS